MPIPLPVNELREGAPILLLVNVLKGQTRILPRANETREQTPILLPVSVSKGQMPIPLPVNVSKEGMHQRSSATVVHMGRINVPAVPITSRNVHQIQRRVRIPREERVIITRRLQQGNQGEVQRVPAILVPARHVRVARLVLQVRAPVMVVMRLVGGPVIATAQQHNAHRSDVLQQ